MKNFTLLLLISLPNLQVQVSCKISFNKDIQSTILHQIGIDPHRFNFPYQGLNQRLIGPTNEGKVVHDILT